MIVTFRCPDCNSAARTELKADAGFSCHPCGRTWPAPADRVSNRTIPSCLICRCKQLYFRKDFPVKLGLIMVLLGSVLSCVTWNFYWYKTTFAVLFATALLDLIVYLFVGEVLVCYRCHAEYRGVDKAEGQEHFELELAERYRQEQRRLRDQHSITS